MEINNNEPPPVDGLKVAVKKRKGTKETIKSNEKNGVNDMEKKKRKERIVKRPRFRRVRAIEPEKSKSSSVQHEDEFEKVSSCKAKKTVANKPIRKRRSKAKGVEDSDKVEIGGVNVATSMRTEDTMLENPVKTEATIVKNSADTENRIPQSSTRTDGTITQNLLNMEAMMAENSMNTESTVVHNSVHTETMMAENSMNTQNTIVQNSVHTVTMIMENAVKTGTTDSTISSEMVFETSTPKRKNLSIDQWPH